MNNTATVQSVGVIGLGLMGSAITRRLLQCGFQPMIWNRTRPRADALLEAGAIWSECPLVECDRVIVSLFSSDVVSEVLTAMLPNVHAGHVIIDTTTGDPQQSAAWESRLAELGSHYLDAPISGSSEQTLRGEATVIVSGCPRTFEVCSDLWPVLGKSVFHVGASGNAAKLKLVSNLVLGLNRAALAEGLALAEALGVDLRTTLEVLRASAAYSRQMDTKGQKMIDQDFSTQAKLTQHLKDVRLILQAAQEMGLGLSLCAEHGKLLELAESMGLGEQDNCSIIQAVRRRK